MSGYLDREREHVPMTRETLIGNVVVIVGTILTVFYTLVAVGAFPSVLGPLHGKVSPAMPVMILLGGSFIIRAGVASPAERWSPRALRRCGWGLIAVGCVFMIVVAVL